MSNENEFNNSTEDMTDDLRQDNLPPAPATPWKTKVAGGIPIEGLTEAQQIAISQAMRAEAAKILQEAAFDPTADVQIVRKSVVPITDFSKLTIDDVYDLEVPIEAKPFMSADILNVQLKDTNYVARWVNKNPQRLGDVISKGFQYVVPEDLIGADAIQASIDAEGHFSINDAVCMKIDKATYFTALRAAHLRAIATTDETNARKRAANQANQYMNKSDSSQDFQSAKAAGKMTFYDPQIGV